MPLIRKIGRIYYSDLYANGKRVRTPLSPDRRMAEAKLAELVKGRDSEKYGHAARGISWSTFREKYLAYCLANKAEETYIRDKASIVALEKFVPPVKLDDVNNPEYLELWKAKRKGKGIGPATINRDLQSIKAMLRRAIAWGYLGAYKISSVAFIKQTRGRLLFYTAEELRMLANKCKGMFPERSINETPHDWLTICLLGARAGLRRSEIHWLSWSDIDFKRGQLSVTPKDGWNPKDFEQRHIPMADDLRRHLEALPRATEWVLGNRPSLDVMTTYFGKICRKAGLQGGIHTLRHTFASHLAQAGVSLYVISKLLGHASVEMTQIYAHLAPETYDKAVSKLPDIGRF